MSADADFCDSYRVPFLRSGRLLYYLVWCEILCQLALLVPALAAYRVLIRCAAFGMSLLLIILLSGRRPLSPPHPSAYLGLAAIIIILINAVSPFTQRLIPAAIECAMTVAIIGPLLWTPKLSLEQEDLRRVLQLIWLFATAGCIMGLLQIMFPEQLMFQPSIVYSEQRLEGLKITLPNGTRVFRAMGFTDAPGGASQAAFAAVLFGIGLLLGKRPPKTAAAACVSLFVGAATLALSQVRVLVVAALVAAAVLLILLALQARAQTLFRITAAFCLLGVAGLVTAFTIGGEEVTARMATLIEAHPAKVYEASRGRFLAETYELLFNEYPLGAGVGRWGMINFYFGRPDDSLWAELEWTGLMYDGGLPLVAAYAAMLLAAIGTTLRVSLSTSLPLALRQWGALLTAYNIACLAMTFDCPFFHSQAGFDFWLLNAALHAVAHRARSAEQLPWPDEEVGEREEQERAEECFEEDECERLEV